MPSFYIIDGHAHIFRAYYAPFRELSSPGGEPTKATFVFTQMLLNLVEQRKPDYLAMVIDHSDETVFRREIYPEYKAHRTPPPPDFAPQARRILQIVSAAGVPIFEVPGFEADDLIATMVNQLRSQGLDVYIVSKDKDLRQLLAEGVRMYDVQSNEVLDAQTMRERFGYGPEQAIEVQTLMGDKTDNVPGIPNVGEATAVRLIQKYGSAMEVLRHADEMTPRMRENLLKFGDRLPISRQLVTLRRDVPLELDLARCAFRGFDVARLRPLLDELGFHSLIKKLGPEPTPPPSDNPPVSTPPVVRGLFDLHGGGTVAPADGLRTSHECDYRLVNDVDAFESFLRQLNKQECFAFDTETSDLGAMRSHLIGMSFSWQEGTGFYVPVRGPAGSTFLPAEQVLPALRAILQDPSVGKVGHNLKYDALVMRNAGIELRGIRLDTMIAAFLLDAGRNSYGIDALAREMLRFEKIPTSDLIGKGTRQISMEKVELDRVTRYAAEDADIAWRLYRILDARLNQVPVLRKLADELEIPLIDVLVEMEYNGIAIDPA
ncbi:MAG: 5'-3' exonuclease H3TH domain-containing protein, partial [Phycisphaerales bacterium]|nr:5'-3' exonuclease H3TH domain-containing protein [Phycisphaerales bacterium]